MEKRKPPLKWNLVIKEHSSNIRVRRVGRHVSRDVIGLVIKVTGRGSKDWRYPRASLSGWKFGAYVHSLPELRQDVLC